MVKCITAGMFGTNCYLYSKDSGNCIIIDPGGDEDMIISTLEESGLVPSHIILTHGHLDHIIAVKNLKEYYRAKGTDIKVGIQERDSSLIGVDAFEHHKSSFMRLGFSNFDAMFKNQFKNFPEADILLKEGDNIQTAGLTVIETPGHTEGCICLYSRDEGLIFSGDTLFNGGIGRTDLPGGDTAKLFESIKKKIFVLPEETIVYPGHGPKTTIGNEKHNNPFF